MAKQRVYVDRIEEGIAVLVEDGNNAEEQVPVSRLPKTVREGDWLLRDSGENETRFLADPATTTARKRRVQRLMDELSR